MVDIIAGMVGDQTTVRVAPEGIHCWMTHQRNLQMREAWDTQRDWIEQTNPRLAFEVAIRYLARNVGNSQIRWPRATPCAKRSGAE